MQGNAQGEAGSGSGGLAHLLLNSYQEHLIQNRLQEEQEKEEGAQEEDEDEEDDGEKRRATNHRPSLIAPVFPPSVIVFPSVLDHPVQRQEEEPTPQEKALLREEFITQMHQRFLDGKDKDFNYRSATPPLHGLSYYRQ